MTEELLMGLTRETLVLTLQLAGPMLLFGMLVGILMSVLQAVTQVQETSLGFIPKAIAVGIAFLICAPWMVQKLVGFTTGLFGDFAVFAR